MKRLFHPAWSALLSFFLMLAPWQGAQAVSVAVVDTGIDPGVLGGALLPGGFDFYNNDDDPSDDSANRHGTGVGHLVTSTGRGSTLVSIKAYSAETTSNPDILGAAFNYAAGLGTPVVVHANAGYSSTPAQALLNVTNRGKIMVMSAGNNGTPNPTGDAQLVPAMGGRGIVAGGLAGSDIGGFSARAGNLANHYLLAASTSPVSSSVGTSMAAARVAGAAAAVKAASPFLSAQDVVSILFDSAKDAGAPGTDAVYGRGILDLNAALNPVGPGDVPTDDDDGDDTDGGDDDGGSASSGGGGGGGGGGGAVLALAALGLGGAWAAGVFDKDEELKKTILTDKYGRAFNFDLKGRLSARDTRPSLFSMLHSGNSPLSIVPLGTSESSFSYAYVQRLPEDDQGGLNPVFGEEVLSMVHRFRAARRDYTLGLNADLSGQFGALSFLNNRHTGLQGHRFASSDVFSTPVLGYSSRGSSFRLGWNADGGTQGLGFSVIDDQEHYGQQSNSILYERTVEKDRYRSGLQVGALLEDNSLLGGSSNGLFGTDQANTYYLGVNGAWQVSPNVTVLGSYFQGLSTVNDSRSSLLDEFSNLRSEGYGVAMVVDRLLSDRDSLGFAWSSPMQTTDGSARLTLPVSQDRATGAIGFERTSLSFDIQDRENIFETYYQYRFSANDDLFAHFSYTENPVNDIELDRDRTLYLGWKHRF